MEKRQEFIGEILSRKGLLNEREVEFCLHEQKITGEKFGSLLLHFGFVTQYDVANALAIQMGIHFVALDDVVPDDETLKLFNLILCRKYEILPLSVNGDEVLIATCHHDLESIEKMVKLQTGKKALIKFAETGKLRQMLYHYYFFLENPIEKMIQNEITNIIADRDGVRTLDTLLKNILHLAVKLRATDVHIRPMERVINIAFRIDGIMHSMLSLGKEFIRLVSTIKLGASMDISDTRLPQGGGFEIAINEEDYDIRVSTLICSSGENVVMRLLLRNHEVLRLSQLGFMKKHVALLEKMFQKPNGIILLTGPTGSGKSTTLHAGLRGMNILEKNVVTIEDPIEYRLPLVRQTEVNEKAGYTFSSAVRHFLRHDPDVILVGEIRDEETAKIAITAAETGHLVLSTLHANSALGVVPRLISLGVEKHMIADALICSVSQRLIRKVCLDCREKYQSSEEEQRFLMINEPVELTRGKGCSSCNQTGYRGRVPIYEIVVISPEFAEGIEMQITKAKYEEIARKDDYVSMYEVGREKVLAGVTTIDEVSHFTSPEGV